MIKPMLYFWELGWDAVREVRMEPLFSSADEPKYKNLSKRCKPVSITLKYWNAPVLEGILFYALDITISFLLSQLMQEGNTVGKRQERWGIGRVCSCLHEEQTWFNRQAKWFFNWLKFNQCWLHTCSPLCIIYILPSLSQWLKLYFQIIWDCWNNHCFINSKHVKAFKEKNSFG